MSASKPVLSQINLVCRDLSTSLAFYRRLGVDIPAGAVWQTATGEHHAGISGGSTEHGIEFDLDSTAFAQHWNSSWQGRTDLSGRVVIGFHVPARADVDALFAHMIDGGYHGLQEPHDALWGARYAIIEDPDGIAVGVMSPVSPDKKSPPPDL
jgi:catechol 2,3-dioxygenase-like lactoylglutathione lyase family enzyme